MPVVHVRSGLLRGGPVLGPRRADGGISRASSAAVDGPDRLFADAETACRENDSMWLEQIALDLAGRAAAFSAGEATAVCCSERS